MHDSITGFFLVCFLFGTVLTLLTFVTGTAHLSLPGAHGLHISHVGHIGHVGHLGHAHPQAQSGGGSGRDSAPVLNLGSALVFLTWFGGVGFLLHALSPLALLLVLIVALLAGLGGAVLIFLFLAKVLLPAQTRLDPEQYRLEGTPVRITAGIPAGGTGEITYTKAGTRRSDAARNIDGDAMPYGEEAVILDYRHGIAYVQTLKRYLNSPASAIAAQLANLDRDQGMGPLRESGLGEDAAQKNRESGVGPPDGGSDEVQRSQG